MVPHPHGTDGCRCRIRTQSRNLRREAGRLADKLRNPTLVTLRVITVWHIRHQRGCLGQPTKVGCVHRFFFTRHPAERVLHDPLGSAPKGEEIDAVPLSGNLFRWLQPRDITLLAIGVIEPRPVINSSRRITPRFKTAPRSVVEQHDRTLHQRSSMAHSCH